MSNEKYDWPAGEGVCQDCGNELWLGKSNCPYADLCEDCYYIEQINQPED